MWCLWCCLALPAPTDAEVVVVLGLPLLVEFASFAELEALEAEIVVELNVVLFVYLPVSVYVRLVKVEMTVEIGLIVTVWLNTPAVDGVDVSEPQGLILPPAGDSS